MTSYVLLTKEDVRSLLCSKKRNPFEMEFLNVCLIGEAIEAIEGIRKSGARNLDGIIRSESVFHEFVSEGRILVHGISSIDLCECLFEVGESYYGCLLSEAVVGSGYSDLTPSESLRELALRSFRINYEQ